MEIHRPVNDHEVVALQRGNDSFIAVVINSKEVLPRSRLIKVTLHS